MFLKKFAAQLRQLICRRPLLWLSAGLVGGVLLWNGFMLTLDATSSNEFCVSCHSMQVYVYQDYQQSIHYRNAEGIQAGCADCHVPKPLGAKLLRKTLAMNDVYHTILGTINTPEKFAARKQHLAERVWQRMKASDSRECRNCHQLQQMDFERQNAVAKKRHQLAKQQQITCIECHKGVAHSLVNNANDGHNSEQGFSLE